MLSRAEYNRALSQLNSARAARSDASWKVDVLNDCLGRLEGLRCQVQQNYSDFDENGYILDTSWRGETASRFLSRHRVAIDQASATYLRQIDATINDINYVRTQQSSQVSSLNATIGQLERAVSEGYRE